MKSIVRKSAIYNVALSLLAMTGPLFAQESWTKILQAANQEGSVFLYTSMPPPLIERIAADFRKIFPTIKLEVSRSSGGPLLAKVDQERRSNVDGADVLVSTEVGWFEARAAEKSLIPPKGPSSTAWPAQYLVAGEIVIGALEPFVIAYNTNAVKVDLRGYSDLLRAEYGAGKLGVSEASSSTNMVAFYDWLEKTQGGDILAKLAAQKPRIYPGTVTPTQAVAAGEVVAAVVSNPSSIRTLMDQGAPIKYAVPNPARGFSTGAAALGWSKRPNAAQVLVDYLMSRRGQQVWNGKGESASPLSGIEGSLDANSISAGYDPKDYPAARVKVYIDRWNRIFGK